MGFTAVHYLLLLRFILIEKSWATSFYVLQVLTIGNSRVPWTIPMNSGINQKIVLSIQRIRRPRHLVMKLKLIPVLLHFCRTSLRLWINFKTLLYNIFSIFFEKLKKKFAVLKCHTHLGNARVKLFLFYVGYIYN